MVIDFAKTDLKEMPVLVLQNADNTPIHTLGYAFNLKADICFDETSSISFDLPAYVDGSPTPGYNSVIGTRIIDMVGWGRFVLVDPSVDNTGDKEIKSCKAYSLEYELTYKKLSLEESTYNFWNPVAPDETILGIILSYLPSWSLGTVDDALIGKYRTFSESNVNIYNFIKSTVQKTYGCIFDFDTYARKINVMATSTVVNTEPVFISSENLAKSIKIDEDTENIFTVLDVNGAEGVTIRSVNPTGENKIYNLDYYMSGGHFSQGIIDKWAEWKLAYQNNQLPYYNLTIEKMLKISAVVTEENLLQELIDKDLATLENRQSVIIEFLASTSDTESESYADYKQQLDTVNAEIVDKEAEIAAQKAKIETLNAEKDALTEELVAINKSTSFENFFSEYELIILDRYFKEDSIEETSFVLPTAKTYVDAGVSSDIANLSLVFNTEVTDADGKIHSAGEVTKVLGQQGKSLYMVNGGTLIGSAEHLISANVINASLEANDDGTFILSGHLGSGSINGNEFASGCISLTGVCDSVTDNTVPDAETPNSYATGSSLSLFVTSARFYFTQNTTEYEQYSVEWDLFEYGEDCLLKLCYPSYTFTVSSANFLSHDEFAGFANRLALGHKLYLELGEDKVLEPILVKVSVDFEDLSSLSLQFGNTFSLADSAFSLVDLLDQSISMGKTVDTNRFNYNNFIDSGASTAVQEFITGALDVSKNTILSSDGMAITWGASGIRCRKWNETGTGYEPEQIAIINNNIVFTDDGWQTAKMGIGRFTDTNLGDVWGVIAPNIVGTLLAGNNLVIESAKKDGGTSVFRVDGDGAVLHNARFDIENGVSHIVLDPVLGFGIGDYPIVSNEDGDDVWDEDKAKFWVDHEGNVHFKGVLEGSTGLFSGALMVGGDTGFRVDTAGNLSIGGTALNPNFYVSSDGTLTAKGGTFSGTVDASDLLINGSSALTEDDRIATDFLDLGNIQLDGETGNITLTGDINLSGASSINWGRNNPNTDNTPSYALPTYIDATRVQGFYIKGNRIECVCPLASSGNDTTSGFVLTGVYNDKDMEYLRIYAYNEYTVFSSPMDTYANWQFKYTDMNGNVHFWGDVEFHGSVVGMTATFG